MSKDEDNEKVGYKNPPKSGQFKKGQSGNKSGKRKGTKNFRTDFMEELQTKIEVTEGNKKVKITKQRALVKRVVNASLGGDSKAANMTIQLLLDFTNDEDIKSNSKPLTEPELRMLQHHLGKQEGEDVDD